MKCFLYAIKLLKRHGGKLLFTFQPNFCVVIEANGRIFHGTTRGLEGWKIKEFDLKAFARWLARKK